MDLIKIISSNSLVTRLLVGFGLGLTLRLDVNINARNDSMKMFRGFAGRVFPWLVRLSSSVCSYISSCLIAFSTSRLSRYKKQSGEKIYRKVHAKTD